MERLDRQPPCIRRSLPSYELKILGKWILGEL